METAPLIPPLSLEDLKKQLNLNAPAKRLIREIIPIPTGTNHLSDEIDELPKNCIFDKGRVGGGGTTIALKNDIPTIICVPTVELIENKMTQSTRKDKKHLFPHEIKGIYSKKGRDQKLGEGMIPFMLDARKYIQATDQGELENYLNTQPVPKIMVTYNSLPKLLELLEFLLSYYKCRSNPKDFFLLIDEWHLLLTEFGYRDAAIRALLDCYQKFGTYCFMSSTPLEEEFIPEEMKDIPVVKAVWEDVQKTTVNLHVCTESVDSPLGIIDVVSYWIQECLAKNLTDPKPYNLYIFVNHVAYMNDLIDKNNLNPANCRVIMSKNNPKAKELHNGLEICSTSQVKDDPKKINFLTSTAFEGSDIEDPIGCIIGVSDGYKDHTLIDINTKFFHIGRRLRDSEYIGNITHVVRLKKYKSKKTEKEYLAELHEKIEVEKLKCISLGHIPDTKHRIEAFNGLIKKKDMEFHYITEQGEICYDPNKKKKYLYDFRLSNDMYKSIGSLEKAYKENGIVLIETIDYNPPRTDNFKQTVQKLEEPLFYRGESDPDYIKLRDYAYAKYDFLEEALEKLGFAVIKKANYRTDSIKRALKTMRMKNSPNKDFNQVAHALKASGKFENGVTITSKETKQVLQEIYITLNITKTATARQLKEYFNIEEKTIWTGSIKGDRCMCIQSPKFTLK